MWMVLAVIFSLPVSRGPYRVLKAQGMVGNWTCKALAQNTVHEFILCAYQSVWVCGDFFKKGLMGVDPDNCLDSEVRSKKLAIMEFLALFGFIMILRVYL